MAKYRHGDVSFHQISGEEAKKLMGEKKLKEKVSSFVVALGEVTGHKHVMTAEKPSINIWGLPLDERLFEVKEPVVMTHEEHGPITIAPGFYVQKIERDFDPFSEQARQALD